MAIKTFPTVTEASKNDLTVEDTVMISKHDHFFLPDHVALKFYNVKHIKTHFKDEVQIGRVVELVHPKNRFSDFKGNLFICLDLTPGVE